jgi:neurofibromin 1
VIWPLQTALVLLLPEVFVHADMSGSQRGNSLAKKIVFLNNLRQALRQSKSADIAASCLITICRAGSLFANDSDSALLSFALDMQNDMREEIFKKPSSGVPAVEDSVERDVLIKAFVSLARLSVDSVVEHLVPRCLDKNSPMSYKITVFAGAAVLASQPRPEQFALLFEAIAPELREYLHGISSMRTAASAVPFNGSLNERMRRNISTDSIGSVELLYQLLELLKIRPLLLYENLSTHGDNWNQMLDKSIDSILKLVCDDDEFVRNSTVIFARRLLSPEAFQTATNMDANQNADKVLEFFWTGT